MAKLVPTTIQTGTLTTGTQTSTGIDLNSYASGVFTVELSFDANASSSVAQVELSSDNSSWTVVTNQTTPATTGAKTYVYAIHSGVRRYVRINLSTVGSTTLTYTIRQCV